VAGSGKRGVMNRRSLKKASATGFGTRLPRIPYRPSGNWLARRGDRGQSELRVSGLRPILDATVLSREVRT